MKLLEDRKDKNQKFRKQKESLGVKKTISTMDEDRESNRFHSLIQPIRDLAANWDVDIAESLENYLEELETLRISLDGGKGNLNFAEAALLIQGSTAIYSKKVEYLHQLVLNVLELICAQRNGNSVGNSEDGEQANGKSGKSKGVSLSIMDDERLLFGSDPTYLLLDDIVEEGHNIDLAVESKEELEKRRSSHRHSMSGDLSRASMILMQSILQEDHGGASLKMSTCQVSSSGALMIGGVAPMPAHEGRLFVGQGAVFDQTAMTIGAAETFEDKWAGGDADDFGAGGGGGDFNDYGRGGDDYDDDDDGDYGQPQGDFPNTLATNTTIAKSAVNADKMPASKKVRVHAMSLLDPHEVVKGSRPIKKGKTYTLPTPIEAPSSLSDMQDLSFDSQGANDFDKFMKGVIPLTGSIFHSQFQYIVTAQRIARLKSMRSASASSSSSARSRMSREFLYTEVDEEDAPNVAGGVGNCGDDDDDDDDDDVGGFWGNDQAGDDYGYGDNLQATQSQPDEGPSDGNDMQYDGNHFDAQKEPLHTRLLHHPHTTASVLAELLNEEDELARRVELALCEGFSQSQSNSYEMLCRRYIDNFMRGAEQYARETNLSRRVNEWTSKLEPQLRAQEEAPVFDIHEYSDKVLTQLSNMDVASKENGTVSFTECVQGKSSAEVCRVFLACLQLANTGNLEVVPTFPASSDAGSASQVLQSKSKSKLKAGKTVESQGVATGASAAAYVDAQLKINAFMLKLKNDKRIKQVETFKAPSILSHAIEA